MSLTKIHDTSSAPFSGYVLNQPAGTLNVKVTKNKKGNIRLTNSDGNILNISADKLSYFISALQEVARSAVKSSRAA